MTNDTSASLPPVADRAAAIRADGGARDAVLWPMLRKYWTSALLVVVVVVVATAFFTLGEKKIYAAEATIQFNPNPPKPLGRRVENIVDMGAGSYWNNQEYYETQYRVIASRRVAQATVNELGLQNDQYFL